MGPPKSVPPNVIVGGSDLPLKNLAMIYRYLQLQWILMIFPTWLDRFPSKWSLVGASYPCDKPAANRPVLQIATRGLYIS